MDQLRFTIPEILSLIGVAQCIYVLVYISLRSGRITRAGLPFVYFSVLGVAFLSDFASNYIGQFFDSYNLLQNLLWFSGPPLSVLLIIQIAQITKTPDLKHYWIVFLIPLAVIVAKFMAGNSGNITDWFVVTGLMAGAVSLLAIWANKDLFGSILAQKTGKERYWLILALIFVNVFFLCLMILSLNKNISDQDIILVRTVLGLGFVYLVSTSLFRIYPQAIRVEARELRRGSGGLSDEDLALALSIERLINLEKVYQEPAYSRSDLARECGASEAVVSRVINDYFKKSFPQLMNEYRIEDAKILLQQTDAPIHVIALEVGFNSLPSFNRVFKKIAGAPPSHFRNQQKR